MKNSNRGRCRVYNVSEVIMKPSGKQHRQLKGANLLPGTINVLHEEVPPLHPTMYATWCYNELCTYVPFAAHNLFCVR